MGRVGAISPPPGHWADTCRSSQEARPGVGTPRVGVLGVVYRGLLPSGCPCGRPSHPHAFCMGSPL